MASGENCHAYGLGIWHVQYLKQRKDTVRCIVQSLTDDQNGDLFEELHRSNVRLIEHDDDSDDDEVSACLGLT